MFVCCECRVLSDRGLCDELITRPEESYRLWCVVVCDLETSRMMRPWPALGRSATEKNNRWRGTNKEIRVLLGGKGCMCLKDWFKPIFSPFLTCLLDLTPNSRDRL